MSSEDRPADQPCLRYPCFRCHKTFPADKMEDVHGCQTLEHLFCEACADIEIQEQIYKFPIGFTLANFKKIEKAQNESLYPPLTI